MGILDAILGRTRLRRSRPEGLFAMSTAVVTLQSKLGLEPTGQAAIVFSSVQSSDFDEARRELEELLGVSERATGSRLESYRDEYGYQWVIARDPDFEDLVSTLHLVAQTLGDHGYQDRLLAAMFAFKREGQTVYWIYSYKSGKYYPFVPRRDRERDTALEMRLAAAAQRELPIEQDTTLWYGLYGAPL